MAQLDFSLMEHLNVPESLQDKALRDESFQDKALHDESQDKETLSLAGNIKTLNGKQYVTDPYSLFRQASDMGWIKVPDYIWQFCLIKDESIVLRQTNNYQHYRLVSGLALIKGGWHKANIIRLGHYVIGRVDKTSRDRPKNAEYISDDVCLILE